MQTPVIRRILFVCLGNICRSPLAEGIAREFVEKKTLDIDVDSCGTGSWHVGETPCEHSVKIARMHNIDISQHRARQITKEDCTAFDLLVALDGNNMATLLQMGCPQEKIVKLGAFGWNNEDVPDPYFFDGFDGFEYVYKMIEECVENLLSTQEAL